MGTGAAVASFSFGSGFAAGSAAGCVVVESAGGGSGAIAKAGGVGAGAVGAAAVMAGAIAGGPTGGVGTNVTVEVAADGATANAMPGPGPATDCNDFATLLQSTAEPTGADDTCRGLVARRSPKLPS